MTAQPVHDEDPQDPQVILRELPERERPEFLRQYREAAQAALVNVAQYKALQRLLHRWSLVAIAANRPGYYEEIEKAKAGLGGKVSFEEAIAAELASRR